jgi:general secretion pathway protein L
MRIAAAWKRWIEILATLVVGVHEAWRARRTLVVAVKDRRLVVRVGDATRPQAQGEITAAARRAFVMLELPGDEIVRQQISLPARAREFLPGLVRNQIERLSPWPADQVVYGFDAAASAKDPETLDTRVLITPRASIEAARNDLAALGVTADRIIAREAGDAASPPVVLWSRYDAGSGRGQDRKRRLIAAALMIVVGLSCGVSAWALGSASALRAESEDTASRSADLQKKLQDSRAISGATLDPAERAWNQKEAAPSGVLLLETLSQALPDNAYVTELSLQKSTMRIIGLTSDAPALIAPIEEIGAFAEVHFFAPTTRGPDGRSFWFHIEARVDSRKGAEQRP